MSLNKFKFNDYSAGKEYLSSGALPKFPNYKRRDDFIRKYSNFKIVGDKVWILTI